MRREDVPGLMLDAGSGVLRMALAASELGHLTVTGHLHYLRGVDGLLLPGRLAAVDFARWAARWSVADQSRARLLSLAREARGAAPDLFEREFDL